ncbi:MAG: hypothetical protein QF415_03485 [Candidatus Undinarchaeales archaeon]|nr:hypothetical protein [Candidatus Undinarchaeales archaeon]
MDENVILLVFGQKLLSRVSEVMEDFDSKRRFPFLRLASNSYILPVAAQKEILDIFTPLGERNKDFFIIQVMMQEEALERVTKVWIADRGILVGDEHLTITEALELLGVWARSKTPGEDFKGFSKSVGENARGGPCRAVPRAGELPGGRVQQVQGTLISRVPHVIYSRARPAPDRGQRRRRLPPYEELRGIGPRAPRSSVRAR